jgi:hypothetical protein
MKNKLNKMNQDPELENPVSPFSSGIKNKNYDNNQNYGK